MPYKEGAVTQQVQPLVRAREYAVSGITAVLGVTLFVDEVQRIRELPVIRLVDYEYLALLAVTGALVFLWIWASEELEMLGRWLHPKEFPASGFNQLAMIMGLAFLLVCLFFAARDIRWYTSLFLIYVIVDFLTLRHVHGIIRHAVDGSYKRAREDGNPTAKLRAKAIKQIEHYYLVRPHDLRRFLVFFAMGIACWLAFQGSNGDIFIKLAYGLSIVTVTASEIVIGYWRQARDDGLRVVEASLSEARRQINAPSSRTGKKRRQDLRGGRDAN